MWNKEKQKYCWHCMAILPTKRVLVSAQVTGCLGFVGRSFIACTKCSNEIEPPKEKDETDA